MLKHLKNNWWKYLVFITYVMIVSLMITKHEPWFDEAQAWLIARDSSIPNLFANVLRHEGSPGLWHLILMIPAKLHMPYIFLNITSAIIASISIFIFLKYSPFPWYIKVLLPFSYYFLYQYAVVARSYTIYPLLLFLIAIIYKNKIQKPYIFMGLLCLLANLNIHGLMIGLGIIVVHCKDVIDNWNALNKKDKENQLIILGIFILNFMCIVLELFPPKDLVGLILWNFNLAVNIPNGFKYIIKSFSEIPFFTVFILSITLLFFKRRKLLLLYIFPTWALLILLTVKICSPWHEGLIFVYWVFVMWIAFEKYNPEGKNEKILTKLILISFTGLLLIQCYWSYKTIKYDYKNSYSGAKEAAEYIKAHNLQNKKILAQGFTIYAILPYFNENFFPNTTADKNHSYNPWSSQYGETLFSVKNKITDATNSPDFIILSNQSLRAKYPEIYGYKVLREFKGGLYFKNNIPEADSYIIYKRI